MDSDWTDWAGGRKVKYPVLEVHEPVIGAVFHFFNTGSKIPDGQPNALQQSGVI